MKKQQNIIKRLFAFVLACSIFFGMEGITYAATTDIPAEESENVISTEDVLSTEEIFSTESEFSSEEVFSTESGFSTEEIFSTENELSTEDVISTENILSTEDSDSTEPQLPVTDDTIDSCGDEENTENAPPVIPTAPGAVPLNSIKQKAYDSITLSWTPLENVSGYIIERKSNKKPEFSRLAIVPATAKSYTDNSVYTGFTYTYRIYAYVTYTDDTQQEIPLNGAHSNELSLKTTYNKKPGSFQTTTARYDRIKLTWTKAEGASGYEIYRSTSASKGFKKIATVNGNKTSYLDKNLKTGTTYYYKIRAYRNNAGVTTRADFSKTKKVKAAPTVPTINVSVKNYATASLKWNKISGANGYTIYRSTSKTGGYKKLVTVEKGSTTNYTDNNLSTGTTYYYKIRAYRTVKSEKVYSAYSEADSAKLSLKTPTLTSLSAKDYRTITINWKKVSGANGYYIYRSTSKNGTYKKVATVKNGSTLSYSNTGVTTGKKYYYKVKAYRTVNGKKVTSSYSGVKYKATALKKVSGIEITPLHANKLKLTWKKVTGAASYNIYRSTTKNGTYKLIKKNYADTSYTNSKLTNGTRYYYKITAVRGSYENGMSDYVSGKAASLELNQTSVVVQKRFSVTVTATASPSATVKWSSSNTKIATVSSDGVIHGVGVGTATIYAKANGITRSIKVKVRQTLDGIDVSKWQGTIDFNAVKAAGYHFVMIRIYNGFEKDPNFETYYKNAVAAGLGVGVYYYSYATSVESAQADAAKVLSILNGRTLNYPIVIDMEDNRQLAGLTNQNRTDIAWAFCNAITASGYQAGLYANTYWLDNYFENSQLANMNLWIARWTQDPSIWHNYTGAGNIFMWQYTSDGSVPGISGRVDLNLGFSD